MKHIISFTVVLFFLYSPLTFAKVVRVVSQEQFDQINNTIHDLLLDGCKDITVDISSGVFYFRENHLELKGIKRKNVSICIRGNNTTIVPVGREFDTSETIRGYDINSSIVNVDKQSVLCPWTETQKALSDVEVIDPVNKLCRVKIPEIVESPEMNVKSTSIMLTAWCRTYYYGVNKIEPPYIYFTAYNLEKGIDWINSKKGYNVNNDYLYSGGAPRYRLCNVKPLNLGVVHICEAQTFLSINDSHFKLFELKGINFLGNKTKGSPDMLTTSLIVLQDVTSKSILIRNCHFDGHNSRIIAIGNTNNVTVDKNLFAHNFRYGVVSDNYSERTSITRNVFEYNGEDYSCDRCVCCSGPDYYVANNSFKNFGYCAISLGVWYGNNAVKLSSGIVEKNNIYYTDDWMKDVWKHSIMDGGAIYLFTKNDGAIIRYNRINNYSGAKDNRGIFCDDGAYGFQIYGNVITGIDNSYCIDSRRVASVEKDKYPKSGIERSNINIVIRDNVLDGVIKFEGHEDNVNGCIKGCNYVLVDNVHNMLNNTLNNVSQESDDIVLEVNGKKEKIIGLESSNYRIIRKTKEWRSIKKYISKE